MEYPSAMTFEIYTPFTLPEELFKGFDVTCNPISYIRNGLGKQMNHNSYKGMHEMFTLYNECLNNMAPDMDIKVLSIKPICLYSLEFVEHIDFEVIVNCYSITPTKSLTYELFYNFVKAINERLSQIKNHPLKDFFVRSGMENVFHRYGFQMTNDSFISLPDIYIPVTDIDINEKHTLEVIRYMDAIKEYYYQCHYKPNCIIDDKQQFPIISSCDNEQLPSILDRDDDID